MEAIVRACATEGWNARVAAVISNRADAQGLAFARQHGIATAVVDHAAFASRDAFDAELAQAIEAFTPDVVALAGFMRILTDDFVARFAGRLVNVHPSLLPRHRGPIPTFYALAEGGTGVSVHVLAPRIDAGGVLAQRPVPLPDGVSVGWAARALHLAALPLVEQALAMLPASPPTATILPYCPFPDPGTLRRMDVPLVQLRDWRASLFAPAGGW